MVINGQATNLESYYEKRDQLEESWREIAGKLEAESASDSTKIEFMSEAWRQEAEVIRKVISENQHQPVRRRGNPYFRSYWRRQTARLGSVH